MGSLGRTDELGDVPSGTERDVGEAQDFDVESRIEELEARYDIEDRFRGEGRFTRRLEHFVAALSSATWLVLAGGSIVGALTLRWMRHHQAASFVGDWAPTLLMIGIYNKLVKLAGTDRQFAMVY
jgi:hypothetical protein